MKHKFLGSFLCLALATTALTGCGNGKEDPKSTPTPTTAVQDDKGGYKDTKPGTSGDGQDQDGDKTQNDTTNRETPG